MKAVSFILVILALGAGLFLDYIDASPALTVLIIAVACVVALVAAVWGAWKIRKTVTEGSGRWSLVYPVVIAILCWLWFGVLR